MVSQFSMELEPHHFETGFAGTENTFAEFEAALQAVAVSNNMTYGGGGVEVINGGVLTMHEGSASPYEHDWRCYNE